MKSILITDLHHRVSWVDDFLASEEAKDADETIFLGDYFDDFGDGPARAYRTAEWLKDRIKNPRSIKEILLMGNHDMAYRYPDSWYAYCSGCTKDKSDAINSILTKQDWQQFRFAYYTQGWLISHAGAHPDIFGYDMTPQSIITECNSAGNILDLSPKQWCLEFAAGKARGGISGVGGITWLDFNKEFKPFKGINQIVGHTPHKVPNLVTHNTTDSVNYCLDTHNRDVYFLVDGVLKIIENKWLI